MDVDSILALGLITNECISNIIKHAYEAENGGVVRVSFLKEGGEYCLSIEDEGKGFDIIKHDRYKSVGLSMISQLSKQLKGELYRQVYKGTSFKVRFPAKDEGNHI
ncbi:MAG: sensor histidine kinase [Ekhidna sp.]|nr:sensor histidine kinase [Ekhidna sp.]